MTFERAYAQAPWTLPSVASYLTGLDPGLLLDEEGQPWGVPESATTLAEALSARGYATAAFVANPTVHADNGFAQGFDTFYSVPFDEGSFDLHGDALADRVLAWLGPTPPQPFFLYVHFIDPHDPYASPELPAGESPFDPGYQGSIRGDEVRALHLGELRLEDPERDVEHLAALYDAELRFADRQVGRVLRGLPETALAHTLIAFTADHGEELGDHGGFRHGETLYDELVRVPLLLRWDDRLPAGERVDATVRLLDLFPTFLAAAGGAPGPALPGLDLLPPPGRPISLPERPATARHLASGPLRVAAIEGGRKLVLFDRERPFAPADEREAALWRRDVARLARRELYDLTADPEEASPLSEPAPVLEEALLRTLDDASPAGLRLAVTGLAEGSVLTGELDLASPIAPESLFLGPTDRVEATEGRLRFELHGDGTPRLLLLPGFESELTALTLDGEPFPPTLPGPALRLPSSPESLHAEAPPRRPEGPSLRLWYRSRTGSLPGRGRDEATQERLRALGYL